MEMRPQALGGSCVHNSFSQISTSLYDVTRHPPHTLRSSIAPVTFAIVGKSISTAFSPLLLFMFSSSVSVTRLSVQLACPLTRLLHHMTPGCLVTPPLSPQTIKVKMRNRVGKDPFLPSVLYLGSTEAGGRGQAEILQESPHCPLGCFP